jgi:hypothetical protein
MSTEAGPEFVEIDAVGPVAGLETEFAGPKAKRELAATSLKGLDGDDLGHLED